MTDQTADSQAAKARVLLVEDDEIVRDSLGGFLRLEGYDVTAASTIPEAMNLLEAGRFNLLITNVTMPSGDGFELLRHTRAHHEDVVVIMITGYGTIASAVEAIRQGAYEYLTKPIIDDDVRLAVERALQQQRLMAENRQLKRVLSQRYSFDNIIGADVRMAAVFDLIEAVADSRSTVLITGESGTGKSMIARAVHARSHRRDKPFVEVACGALPDSLLASELFGHVRGAFTGAVSDKPGKFAAADGGTIFLDEIATSSPQLQVKLLRVLQDRTFEPVGSNHTQEVDVRVILATHCDLNAEVAAGRFRSDLYYRVNVVNIELPALRDRITDIPLLAKHFLGKFLAGSGKRIEEFSDEAMETMLRYSWPGNVRELENCVERAVVLCRQGRVGQADLPPAVRKGVAQQADLLSLPDGPVTLREVLAETEKRVIQDALDRNKHSRQATAGQLGIDRATLFKKMKKHGLME